MRLTCVLLRHNYYRTIQIKWKKQGRMEINELSVPPELQEMGVEIHDAKELFQTKKPQQVEEPIILTNHHYSREGKYYLFNKRTRVTEGLDQVLALTKTISYEGLPLRLKNLVGVEQLANQDDLVKDCIKQALVWDGWQVKLPKKIDIERPSFVFPRDYGVPHRRKVSSLLNKLVLLCEIGSGKYAESLKRTKIPDVTSEVLINSGGDSVTFQMCSDILVADEKPLKPFTSLAEVEETKLTEVPSLYPIKATLDLDQFETCPASEISGEESRHAIPKGYVHTLHVPHRSIGFHFPVQKQARGIACCFSFAAEQARRLYGPDVKELLEPISVQCIYMDLKAFGFLAYQLNTLDLSNKEGVKNQVWIDGPYDLYEELSDENGITNYNPDIFTKMLAFYMNGVHPRSSE